MNELDKKLLSLINPVLFFLSQIKPLTDNMFEKAENFKLYKPFQQDLISTIYIDFLTDIKKSINEDKDNFHSIFMKYSELFINTLLISDNNIDNYKTPGELLSSILKILEEEEEKSSQYIKSLQGCSIMDINEIKKEYNIYSENDMLEKFLKEDNFKHDGFINRMLYNITKINSYCKNCKQTMYNYESNPTLEVFLSKSPPQISEKNSDYEMINTLLSKINFQKDLSSILYPNYFPQNLKCEKCKKITEGQFTKNIQILKEGFFVNVNREQDPKNEMIFIYDEILDLSSQSNMISNYYQLFGVISKVPNEQNICYEDKYISYFRKGNEDSWVFFDENCELKELEKKELIFDFKGVSLLYYKRVEQ